MLLVYKLPVLKTHDIVTYIYKYTYYYDKAGVIHVFLR